MMLADHILAARGGDHDIGDVITSLAAGVERAERFVLADEISHAAYQLIQTKPLSLLDAMPMCRLPYPSIWLEWDGAASLTAGWHQYPTCEPDKTINRPTPRKMGALIETVDDSGGQRGTISWAWQHHNEVIHVCGLGCNFDWSKDGDVCAWSRQSLGKLERNSFVEMCQRRWVDDATISDEAIIALMNQRPGWRGLSRDPKQVAAVRGLLRHEAPWFCRHAGGMISAIAKMDLHLLTDAMRSWEGDICGEAPFVTAFVLMLNSRNAVDREPSDLDRLNKARRRRGRPEFLDHTVTKLHLSKSRLRSAQAQGVTRDAARQHLVMGHFKLKRGKLYWWNPFLRGDASRPMTRKHYETVT